MKTAEDILNEKKRDMVWVQEDQTVSDAVRVMVDHAIGAVLIKKEGRMVGIFSERDLLRNMANPDFNPKLAHVGDYMSTPLHCVSFDTPLIKLYEKFLGLFIRHILIEKGDQQLGMLSIGDVLRASLLEQDKQIKELNAIASWEYYEDWGWDRKKRK
jgi:signal-transduction protein with cAMP-binding, CBS, and nucleotidyltransferase domain